MADIVFSYARSDRAFAQQLSDALEQRGLDVWWDVEIMAGQNFRLAMQHQLNEAKVVLVIWSKQSTMSDWVRSEAIAAFAHNKYLGLRISDDAYMPIVFRKLVHLDWREGSSLEPIVAQILKFLKSVGFEPDAVNATARTPRSENIAKGYAFISHVEEDIPVVSQLSKFLRDRGYAYWTYHETDRDYQKPTHLEIEERLLDSSLMLTVLSPDWKQSEWTFRELWFAREIRKPMFLLRFRDPGPTLAIAGDTFIEFEADKDEGFRRLGIELDKKGL